MRIHEIYDSISIKRFVLVNVTPTLLDFSPDRLIQEYRYIADHFCAAKLDRMEHFYEGFVVKLRARSNRNIYYQCFDYQSIKTCTEITRQRRILGERIRDM